MQVSVKEATSAWIFGQLVELDPETKYEGEFALALINGGIDVDLLDADAKRAAAPAEESKAEPEPDEEPDEEPDADEDDADGDAV